MLVKFIETEDLRYRQESPKRVSTRARRILAELKSYRDRDVIFTQRTARWAAAKISQMLSSEVAADVIYAELALLVGAAATDDELVKLACSISGAVQHARDYGEAEIGLVDIEAIDCWAVIKQVTIREDSFNRASGRMVVDCKLVLTNSVLAGQRAIITIGFDRVRWWASKLGLTGTYKDKLTWHSPYQLLDGNLISRVGRVDGIITVEGVGYNALVKQANREIGRSRDRSKTPCPYGADYHCVKCSIGRNECRFSCNPQVTNYLNATSNVDEENENDA